MRTRLLATLIGAIATDTLLLYQIPVMVRAGLSLGTAAAVAGFRGLAQLAGRLPLGRLISRLGARTTIVVAYILGAVAALLLWVSGTLVLALVFSLMAGASIGALSSLQGIYTHELVDARHLGALLGTQQAVFGVGAALGPLLAGSLLEITRSYTPTILIVIIAFAAAAGVLVYGAMRERSPAARMTSSTRDEGLA